MMVDLKIVEGSDKANEILAEHGLAESVPAKLVAAVIKDKDTKDGYPSIILVGELEDGTKVMIQHTARMLNMITSAAKGRAQANGLFDM